MKRLLNQQPSRALKLMLGVTPFIVLLLIYIGASNARLAENPNDKLLPSMSSFAKAIDRMAFSPSKRSGEYLMLQDTISSLKRLSIGVLVSGLSALIFGVLMGAIPYARANLSPMVTAISLVPPMAILPVLFIVFGIGELSKIVLIVIGIAPVMVRDILQRVLDIPSEQLVKAQTLGASTWQIINRIILPQIMPRLLISIRLSLGAAWLFLIAAEAIAATDGLGYRIFLVRRYMAMDVIMPYVVWIAFLAFLLDYSLRKVSIVCFPWFHSLEKSGV